MVTVIYMTSRDTMMNVSCLEELTQAKLMSRDYEKVVARNSCDLFGVRPPVS